ncbi:MAG: hypothetical protein KR126chlam2_00332 [Chlamydiae bacterium]|nr:hypothetical protein [Chlamydiota bacterium]
MMKYILPILAGVGLMLGIIMVFVYLMTPPTPPIPFPPAKSPYIHAVAGVGIVEAASEDLEIGTPFTEIVQEVYVKAGNYAEKGAPLFKLETESLESELAEVQGDYQVAYANYQKQLDLPRPEDVPIYEDLVGQANATYLQKLNAFGIVKKVTIPKAVSADEFDDRKFSVEIAKYALDEAEDRLALLEAGAWIADLEIYRAELRKTEARVKVVKTKIERSTIRAPLSGMVLQVNTHVGETASATELLVRPLMLFGSVDPLHIRIDIDEEDVWRVIPGAAGTAFVRGNSEITVPLEFVRLEPFLIPKRYLTGDNDERVDTRVLQQIYEFERGDRPIYPGQVMDVFLEAKPNLGES